MDGHEKNARIVVCLSPLERAICPVWQGRYFVYGLCVVAVVVSRFGDLIDHSRVNTIRRTRRVVRDVRYIHAGTRISLRSYTCMHTKYTNTHTRFLLARVVCALEI